MNLRNFAKSLPCPIKQGLKYIYGAIPPRFRYGKVFWDTYNFQYIHKDSDLPILIDELIRSIKISFLAGKRMKTNVNR